MLILDSLQGPSAGITREDVAHILWVHHHLKKKFITITKLSNECDDDEIVHCQIIIIIIIETNLSKKIRVEL